MVVAVAALFHEDMIDIVYDCHSKTYVEEYTQWYRFMIRGLLVA